MLLENGMSQEFLVVIERDEEGYLVGSVPTLKGCHTQARSMDELLERVREAIQLCLEVEGEAALESLELVGVQRITV
jgi:predicted RNase H-like HicB family nuclease